MAPEIEIVDDERRARFETTVDGHVAELTYKRRNGRLVLIHTGVPDELEGRGIGSALVAAAIDSARDQGLKLVVRCPFARSWIERHPDAVAGLDVKLLAEDDESGDGASDDGA